MSDILLAVRGILQVRAATAAGFPGSSKRQYEGVFNKPPSQIRNECWAVMYFAPMATRPLDMAPGGVKSHTGVFQVSLYYSKFGSPGTGPLETLAGAVRDVFPANTTLGSSAAKLTIRYAERVAVHDGEADWMHCPVTVGWQCISTQN